MEQTEILREILEILKKDKEKIDIDAPATVQELVVFFGSCRDTIMPYMKRTGSPAFKVGTGRNAKWMATPREMMAFMKEVSESFKG